MQKIYENSRTRYCWNFNNLDITYFEIPKTGSSSVKTTIFRANYGLKPEDNLNIGGGKLAQRFPNSLVSSFEPDDFLGRILVIYRDPIARVKSTYRSIFLGRQKLTGSLSEYFKSHFRTYITSPSTDGLLNHHKPMSWFFPISLLEDPRVVFVETIDLNDLPQILKLETALGVNAGFQMPHLLNVNKSIGDIDMDDSEIKEALGQEFEVDFDLFNRLSK